jgi:hypothetical protein
MDQREVRAAWEKFVERGALSADLRSSVAASWQRSRNHQITVDRAQAPLVADNELFRHRTRHAPLRHAARCALQNSKTFLGDAGSMMILTDPTGLVIDTQGDARVIEAGRTVHLEHGGRWSEADIRNISVRRCSDGLVLRFRFTIRATGSCSAWSTFRVRQAHSIPRAWRWQLPWAITSKAFSCNRSSRITKSCCTIF